MVLSNTVKKTSGVAEDSGDDDEAGYKAARASAVKLALAEQDAPPSSGVVSDELLKAQAAREKSASLAIADDSTLAPAMLSDESLKAQDTRDKAVSLALAEDGDEGYARKVGNGAKQQDQTQCKKSNNKGNIAGTTKAEHEVSKSKKEASDFNVGIGASNQLSQQGKTTETRENETDGTEESPQLTSFTRSQAARITSRPGAVAVEGIGGEEVGGAMAEYTVPVERGMSGLLRSVGTSGTSSGYNSSVNDDYDLEGMAEARPVDEENLGNLQNAEPVSGVGDPKPSMTAAQQQEKRSTQCFLITAAVMAVGLIVGLSVVFTRQDSNDTISTVISTGVPTGVPTGAPTAVTYVLELPEYTLREFQDPVSPQSKAYDWLLGNPTLGSYPEWKKAQRFALATFYYSLGGGEWILEDDWLDPELDECEWFHRELIGSPQNVGGSDQLDELSDLVELVDSACDDNGQYRFLVFPNNNLRGTLPKEIALLSTGLVFLDISTNADIESPVDSLRGSIPTEIGLLTKLRRFYSDRNLHTGPIPTELGLLQNLEELDIGYSPFSGGVPTELGNLGNSLKLLSIKRSGVTGFLPTELYQLTNLEAFFMHGNTGITGGLLSPDIKNMKKMQRFVAHDIPYQSPIPSEIGLLTDMWEFNMWNTGINGTIPAEFWELTNMERLDIDENALSGAFPVGLGNFTALTQLFINSNLLTGTLPSGIFEHLGQLTYLKMNDNLVTGTLPTQLGLLNKTVMGDLLMAHNNFTGTIPSQLGLVTSLQSLVLHGTSLTGSLPSELLALSELSLLTVSNTSLTGSIPDDLCDTLFDYEYQCTSIQGLYEICYDIKKVNFTCENSQLCGCECGECPDATSF